MEDAVVAGLVKLSEKSNNKVKVITTKNDHVGIILSETPQSFLNIFNNTELIIAKGMGYYESLSEENLSSPIAHLFKIKCRSVAEDLNLSVNKNICMVKEKSNKQK